MGRIRPFWHTQCMNWRGKYGPTYTAQEYRDVLLKKEETAREIRESEGPAERRFMDIVDPTRAKSQRKYFWMTANVEHMISTGEVSASVLADYRAEMKAKREAAE